jgi:hypothetical protein
MRQVHHRQTLIELNFQQLEKISIRAFPAEELDHGSNF